LSLEEGTTSESELESPSYILVSAGNPRRLQRLTSALEALTTTPDPWQTPYISLVSLGRDVGRVNGRLSLLCIGLKDEIFIVDVLTYAKALDALKGVLQSEEVEKVVWDVRDLASELWHGHEIGLSCPVDLQLLHVYEKTSLKSMAGFHHIEGLHTAYSDCEEKPPETEVHGPQLTKRTCPYILLEADIVQREIEDKQLDDKEFWLRRPVRTATLEYSSFQILQLRAMYNHYLPSVSSRPSLKAESTRYATLYSLERPPSSAWYLNPSLLPQEILTRPPEVIRQCDHLGTRTCAACRRRLHQDSFSDSFARRWTLRLGEHGRVCYTCAEARRIQGKNPLQTNLSPTRWTAQEEDISISCSEAEIV
jgi:hypothetical protein